MNLTKRIITWILIFVLLIAIGVATYILYKFNMLPFLSKKTAAPKKYTYEMGDFTVNLDEPGYKRYIKVTVYFGSEDKKLGEELEEKKPQIRSEINNILRSKKVEDVSSTKNTENVINEMKDKVNSILTKGKIANVYFTDILIQ